MNNYIHSEKQFFDCVPFCHHKYIKNKKYLCYAVLYYLLFGVIGFKKK